MGIESIGPPPIVQICWVVDSIEVAVPRWIEATGAGPFFLAAHIPFEDLTYRGKPSQLDQSSAIGQWGGVQVELFEQHCDNPSGARDMYPRGETGLQHMTWFADDLDLETARLEALGFPVVMTGRLPSMGRMRLAWFDARALLGVMIEVYEESDLMRRLYSKVARAAQGWDGSDPLHSLG
jgi:methylmalonyl-CoA/ethylmalonyl-CoA epimerase